MIFERAPDEAHAVGKQRGSKRVAGMASELLAIEGEGKRAGAIDEAPEINRRERVPMRFGWNEAGAML